MSKKPNLLYGALFSLLSYLMAAIMSACAKLASDKVSVVTILFFANIVCFLLNLPKALHVGIKTEKISLHLTRSIAGFLSFFTLLWSIQYIPLANAVLLQNSAPLWIPFVIWIWAKKRVPHYLWYSLVIGFLGVILILKPSGQIIDPFALAALVGGMLLAIGLFAIRRLSSTEPFARVVFYYFLLGSVVTFPFALKDMKIAFTGNAWIFILGVAASFYIAQLFITWAFGHGKASTLSPFCYSAVVFSAILDGLIWHHYPDLWSIFGMLLVIIGGIASVLLEKKYESKFV